MSGNVDVELGASATKTKTHVKHHRDGSKTVTKTMSPLAGSSNVEETTEEYSMIQAPAPAPVSKSVQSFAAPVVQPAMTFSQPQPPAYIVDPNPKKSNKGLIIATSISGALSAIFWILFFLLLGWLWLLLGVVCLVASIICGIILCARGC